MTGKKRKPKPLKKEDVFHFAADAAMAVEIKTYHEDVRSESMSSTCRQLIRKGLDYARQQAKEADR